MDPSRYHHLILFSSSPFGAYKVEDIDGNARYSCLGFRNAPAGLLAGFSSLLLLRRDHALFLSRKTFGRLVLLGFDVAVFTPAAYLRHRL